MEKAPFTNDKVKALNEHQESGQFHPHTCDRSSVNCQVRFLEGDGVLIAKKEGLVCPCGNYKQNWCH